MSKSGPILIIEDDEDDKDFLETMIRNHGFKNEIKWFVLTKDAYEYLSTTDKSVFMMFCDINMPRQNGLQFKHDLDADPLLRKKSIPFLFYSTSASQEAINEAYTELTVQGFFVKGSDYEQEKIMLKTILDYWGFCRHPNT